MVSELTPRHARARSIISIPGFANCVGACMVILIGLVSVHGVAHGLASWHWRAMLMAGMVPNSLGLIIVLWFVPESPRYLLVRDRMYELRDTMIFIADMNECPGNLVDGGSCRRLSRIERDESIASSVWELLTDKHHFVIQSKVTGIWCLLAVCLFGQSFLLPILLEDAALFGISKEQEYFFLLLSQAVEVPALLFLCVTIDHPDIGRRDSIRFYAALCAVSALILHFIWTQGFWVLLIFVLTTKVFAVMAFEGMYVYTAELVPTSHRQAGVSLGIGLSKLSSGIAGMLLMPFIDWSSRHDPRSLGTMMPFPLQLILHAPLPTGATMLLTCECLFAADQSEAYLLIFLAGTLASMLATISPVDSIDRGLPDLWLDQTDETMSS